MVYYVKLNNEILNAINSSKIDKSKIKNYNNLIPLSILEKACNKNLKNKFCNINLQYTWFCLNGEYVYRRFIKGWRKFKVSFYTVYVENSQKNRKIISDAYNLCPKPKSKIFSKISNKHYVSIREYISGKNKIPLSVFLKSCQILDKDPWVELNNTKIYSGSSIRDKFILFKNKITPELYILLNWIKLEGNLSLSSPYIRLSQHVDNARLCFEKLNNYFEQVFGIPNHSIKIQNFKSTPKLSYLIISSAPLRQILNLKYGIPLGHKSKEIKPNQKFNFNREDKLKILASEIETDGSFARHKKHNIIHCDVSFSVHSKDYSKSVFVNLNKLGYPATFIVSKRNRCGVDEVEYITVFWGLLKLQKFAFEIMPYFHHLGKIRNLIEVVKQKDYLKITRIDFNEKIKKMIYQAKGRYGDFKSLTKKLNELGLEISQNAVEAWVYQSNRVPVYAIIKMCSIVGEKNYFKFLPKELAFSLWIQGFISRKEAESIRGIKDAYEHIENIVPTLC